MSCFVAFHYRSYGTFFLHKNRLHKIYRGFTHYKYYRADFVFQLLGQGNYVVSYGQTQIDGVVYAQYDIFRLENGKIVEHWDNKEVMPKVEDLTNRGKF